MSTKIESETLDPVDADLTTVTGGTAHLPGVSGPMTDAKWQTLNKDMASGSPDVSKKAVRDLNHYLGLRSRVDPG
jgi:hypothetical protein